MLSRMLFRVSAGEETDFRAAWAAESPPGLTLYRALRGGRFAALPDDSPAQGVLLVAEMPPAEWERRTGAFAGRQGFLGAWRGGELGVAHWSSPLMYQRGGV